MIIIMNIKEVENGKIQVIRSFKYLGDTVSENISDKLAIKIKKFNSI